MRLGAERAHKARTLRVGNTFHNDRPTGLAQLVEHRLRRSDHYFYRPHRFAGLDCCSFCGRALYGPAGSTASCASCSCCSCCSHGFLLSPGCRSPAPSSLLVFTSLLPTLNHLLVLTLVPARLLAPRLQSPPRLRRVALCLASSSS